jgi:hypothetical protein
MRRQETNNSANNDYRETRTDSRATEVVGDRGRSAKYDGKYKGTKFNLSVWLGDLASGLFHFLVNPNSLYFLTVGLAGLILVLSAVPYINLFGHQLHRLTATVDAVPFIRRVLGAGLGLVASVLGITLMMLVNALELIPIAPRFIEQWGERLYFKSNKKRYETPYEGPNGSLMAPRAYRWVRRATHLHHDIGLGISLLMFAFDAWVDSCTYPLFDRLGGFNVQNLFYVGLLLFGFIACVVVAAIFNSHRLNRVEQNEFDSMKERLEPRKYSD